MKEKINISANQSVEVDISYSYETIHYGQYNIICSVAYNKLHERFKLYFNSSIFIDLINTDDLAEDKIQELYHNKFFDNFYILIQEWLSNFIIYRCERLSNNELLILYYNPLGEYYSTVDFERIEDSYGKLESNDKLSDIFNNISCWCEDNIMEHVNQ